MKLAVLSPKCEGATAAKPIYNKSGNIILNAGGTLSSFAIKKLKQFGISSVYIEEKGTEDIVIDDIISIDLQLKMIRAMESTFSQASAKKSVDISDISELVKQMLESMSISENSVPNSNSIRNIENSIAVHSINVAILSSIIGIHMGYNFDKLYDLSLGAILHDIGRSVSNGNEHTLMGFEILRNISSIKSVSAIAALQHHENCDGKGYPRKIKSKEIHEFSKIVAICNEYDNLTSIGVTPSEALERMIAQTPSRFDEATMKIFQKHTYIYPTGTEVTLSNGEKGIVCAQNKSIPSRPIVKTGNKYYNLIEELTLFINAA